MRFIKYPLVLAIITSLAAGYAFAAKEESAPSMSDREVLQYLNTAQTLEWERTKERMHAARSQIETGTRLMERPGSRLQNPNDIARDRADGKEMVRIGEATLADAQQTLDQLRAVALEAKGKTQTVEITATVYPYEFESETLENALLPVAEELLFSLWNAGYGRIYLNDIYIIDTADKQPAYEANSNLSNDLRQIIARLDGNRFTFVNNPDIDFEFKQGERQNYLDFPEREAALRNFKCALIVAEIAFDSREESALLSLRGIDLKSGYLIASKLALLTVDDDLKALFFSEESKSETNASDQTPEQPVNSPKQLVLQLRDERSFINRLAEASTPYVFSFEFVGDTTGFSSRAASMISKFILLENSLNVSDDDFLIMAMASAPETSEAEADQKLNTNAVWKLTPLGGSGKGRNAYDIEAVSLLGSQHSRVPVGLLRTAIIENEPVKSGG